MDLYHRVLQSSMRFPLAIGCLMLCSMLCQQVLFAEVHDEDQSQWSARGQGHCFGRMDWFHFLITSRSITYDSYWFIWFLDFWDSWDSWHLWGFLGISGGFLGCHDLRNSKAVYAAWLECTCEVPGARQAQKSGGDLVIGNIRVKAWDCDEVLLSEIVLLIPIIVIRLPNHCGHWRHSKLNDCVLVAGNLCRQDSDDQFLW